MKVLYFIILSLLITQSFAQRQDRVDFIRGEVFVEPIPEEKQINGHVTYTFTVLQNVDSVFLDAKNMEFTSALLDSKTPNFTNNGNTITVHHPFKQGNSHTLTLGYTTQPKQTLYFMGWEDDVEGNEQIWTQGQGKYTSHWLPSFDDMNEKVEFDLNISANPKFDVVANGKLKEIVSSQNGDVIHSFDMEHPMSSYLLALAIGKYQKQQLTSESGIPIDNHYYPSDSLRAEPTYRYTKKIFDFLEAEIGVPYPWQNYKQIPVRDFLYAGMENTGTTIFSDGYVIDSTAFVDKNYVNVNAHELAHQWFGNLVTEVDGNHHWLHEGFATYYAYLAEKEIFGDDHYFWKLYRSLLALQEVVERGEGQSLLDPKASSLIFYEKGAWALHMLRHDVGDDVFRKGIVGYLRKYRFKNVTVDDFLNEMERAGGKELSRFKEDWLVNDDLPFVQAKKVLAADSPSLELLFKMEEDVQQAQGDDIDYSGYWNTTTSIHLKQHIVGNYGKVLPAEIIGKAFASDTVTVRQALSMVDDPKTFPKAQFETLLEDHSYFTIENALLQLWMAYPEDRPNYLNATKGIVGLPNKNVRLLWLTLAILTNGYDDSDTKNYFDELSGYTNPRYSFEVRQIAFQYLKEAFGFTEQNLLDLAEATAHHSWQFRKFSRALLDSLLQDEVYKERISMLVGKLEPDEKRYIQSKLN
ncbi:M1 family metallopeptidase [Flavobacteriaceae bacterium TP-CH-4]|uniref:Aminopeptidase N n=1 Tax=Pelagihabitans pacificus TaxID=2696054 RepID=A0A967AVT9_9FLAO|nr:M1 family metallopeptidase [Pelagihabitans pacificus]NHF60085.1 M1 family metallopeptidase [Pelagihabitans pacificus]